MKNIQYVGEADFRQISASDFEGLGHAETGAVEFSKLGVLEVEDDVADTLIDHPTFRGEFTKVTKKDAKELEKEAQEAADEAAKQQLEADAAGNAAGIGDSADDSGDGAPESSGKKKNR